MSDESPDGKADKREEILRKLDDSITELSKQIDRAKPENPEEVQLQLKRHHEIGYLANQFRKMRRDRDIDQMQEELELLRDTAEE